MRPLPYMSLGVGVQQDLHLALSSGLGWAELRCQRQLARLRLRLVRLAHIGGARSWARRQCCICCGAFTHSPTFHALAACERTEAMRQAYWRARQADAPTEREACTRAILSSRPEEAGYAEAAALASFLEKEEASLWAKPPGAE